MYIFSSMQDRPGYVYLLKSPTGYWKIGRTKNPNDRRRTFSVKLPFEVQYEHLIPCKDMVLLEGQLHEQFSDYRKDGEWFALSDDQVKFIKRITTDADYMKLRSERGGIIMGRRYLAMLCPAIKGQEIISTVYYESLCEKIDEMVDALALYQLDRPELMSNMKNSRTFDMLEALKDALWTIDNMTAALNAKGISSTITDPRPKMRAAIKKAEG